MDHSLVRRQLKKLDLDDTVAPTLAAWQQFLDRVSQAYAEADRERYLLERSLTISSQEMQELYENLQKRTEALSWANEQLKQEVAVRKQTEAEVRQARDQALEASRLKSELLAKVSHELRTPLGAILGYTEMLELGLYGQVSADQRDVLARIINSTQYLANLVNELLDQARLDAGKLELQISAFRPKSIVQEACTRMEGLAQSKGLNLISEIADDMPPTLSGDPMRLQQILANLISNAIKFTPDGSISVRLYRPDPAHWAMQVTDTGPGILKEAQAYIFEPFRQVDGSMTRKHQGSGLGLSIVRQLANLMGGDVLLESEVGRGSIFTVRLPLHVVEEE
jgi:signal transduction histidine kinase